MRFVRFPVEHLDVLYRAHTKPHTSTDGVEVRTVRSEELDDVPRLTWDLILSSVFAPAIDLYAGLTFEPNLHVKRSEESWEFGDRDLRGGARAREKKEAATRKRKQTRHSAPLLYHPKEQTKAVLMILRPEEQHVFLWFNS